MKRKIFAGLGKLLGREGLSKTVPGRETSDMYEKTSEMGGVREGYIQGGKKRGDGGGNWRV